MPGHVKRGGTGDPDPDPAPFLYISYEEKQKVIINHWQGCIIRQVTLHVLQWKDNVVS